MVKDALDMKLNKLIPDIKGKERTLVKKRILEHLEEGGQVGQGFFDSLKSGIKSVAKAVAPIAKTAASTAVQNIALNKIAPSKEGCTNRNPDWEYNMKPGESHQVYVTKEGCRYNSRFSGPGTHVLQDVNELLAKYNNSIANAVKSSNFTSDIDKEALAHDIRYVLATNGDPSKVKDLVREADNIFIKKLSTINDSNAVVPLSAMRAKVAGEKAGVISVYAGDEKVGPSDLKLLQDMLNHLEMQGFGIDPKGRIPKDRPLRPRKREDVNLQEPGEKGEPARVNEESVNKANKTKITDMRKEGSIKGKGYKSNKEPSKWIKHVQAYSKKHNISYKDAMAKAKSTYKP